MNLEKNRRSFLSRRYRHSCKYEIYEGKNGRWYWRLVAANGEISSPSEAYTSRADALRGAKDNKEAAKHARFVLV